MYQESEVKSMVSTFEMVYLRAQTELEDVLGLISLLQLLVRTVGMFLAHSDSVWCL